MDREPVRPSAAEAAWAAWHANLSVVPPREDGSKAPLGSWSEYQTRRATERELAAWYGPRCGVGLVTGYGGLEVLEFEGRAVEEGVSMAFLEAAEVAGLGSLLDRIRLGYQERSPSGGRHLLYRVATPRPNTRLARRPATEAELAADPSDKVKVLAETRGVGGYIITSPSNGAVHPSGGAWTLEAGGFESIATITDTQRDDLLDLVRVFDRMPVPPPRSYRAGSATDERASDRWAARPDIIEVVLDLLERHGWTLVRTRPDGVHELRRPGKHVGISATLGYGGPGVLHVFSTSTEFEAGSHSPFTVYGTLEHDSDWRAAGRALYEAEGPRTITSGDAAAGASPVSGDRLPASFWEARPYLGHVRQAAWSRQRSPDAVFAAVLCRVAASLPRELGLPPIVGSECGLSLLAAIVAYPGFGKSTGVAIAQELQPVRGVIEIPSGSGEGLIEAMFETVEVPGPNGKPRRERVLTNRNLLAVVDEGQKATTLAARSGSTLYATWRSAFTGTMLGEANASAERNRVVPAGSYNLAVLAIFQPAVLEPLFDDLDAGTPSRFLYFSATDPTMPDEPPDWPGMLDEVVPDLDKARPSYLAVRRRHLFVHDSVAAVIRRDDLARQRGEAERDDWGAHRNLLRLKVAALLALMDGSLAVREGDWELAGIVVETSDAVRRDAQAAIADRLAQKEAATTRRQAERGVAVGRAMDTDIVLRAAERIALVVGRHPDGIARKDVRGAVNRRQRPYFDEALDLAVERGWVRVYQEPGQGTDKVVLRPGTVTS